MLRTKAQRVPVSHLYFCIMGTHKILLVEDDVELGSLVVRLFEMQAVHTERVGTLAQARQSLANGRYDALVLDIMLPDGNGLDLCREVRTRDARLPILMLSARGDTIDRVLGLEIGADDYVAKPFEAAELVARVRALLRRGDRDDSASAGAVDSLGVATTQTTKRQMGAMQIDLIARRVVIDKYMLELTSAEFKLLLVLSQSPGQPISRDALSRAVQPGAYIPSDRSVDVQVARLRKKLHEADPVHEWIATVRGEGYVFTIPMAR
jgi:two-component system, OmpR family, phosphate regulon response regulator OmpR